MSTIPLEQQEHTCFLRNGQLICREHGPSCLWADVKYHINQIEDWIKDAQADNPELIADHIYWDIAKSYISAVVGENTDVAKEINRCYLGA